MDKALVEQVVATAASVVAGGAISANGHGNVSLRVPGAEEMYYTAAPSLRGLGPGGIVRVALDGTLLEGDLPPIQAAVVAMHTAHVPGPPRRGLRRPHALAVRHRLRGGQPADRLLDRGARHVRPRRRRPRGRLRAPRLRAGGRQHPRRGRARACRPCCWRTTACSSSIARPSSPSSSAGSSRRRRRLRSTPARWAGRSRSRPTLRAAALQRAMSFDAAGTKSA